MSRRTVEQLSKLKNQPGGEKKNRGQFAPPSSHFTRGSEHRERAEEKRPRQIRDRFRVKEAIGNVDRVAQRNRRRGQKQRALPSIGARLVEPSFQEFEHDHLTSFLRPQRPCLVQRFLEARFAPRSVGW